MTNIRHTLAQAFAELANYQHDVSSRAPEWDGLSDTQRASNMSLGLLVEAGELFNALKIKPWRPDHDGGPLSAADLEEATLEFADVLAFLAELMYLAWQRGLSPLSIAGAYVRKSETNRKRFAGDLSDRCKSPPCPWNHSGTRTPHQDRAQ